MKNLPLRLLIVLTLSAVACFRSLPSAADVASNREGAALTTTVQTGASCHGVAG